MVEKTIDTRVADLHLFSNGLVYLGFKNDKIVELEDRLELAEAIEKLAVGIKRKVLIQTGERNSMTPEARKLDMNKRIESVVLKEALIINTLGIRISASFYYKLRKPIFPVKVFSNYDEAFDWLEIERLTDFESMIGS